MARSATDIQADLTAAYAARRQALNPGYSLDTGQGRQSVTPVDLDKIQGVIDRLEDEMADATGANALITGTYQRHG